MPMGLSRFMLSFFPFSAFNFVFFPFLSLLLRTFLSFSWARATLRVVGVSGVVNGRTESPVQDLDFWAPWQERLMPWPLCIMPAFWQFAEAEIPGRAEESSQRDGSDQGQVNQAGTARAESLRPHQP